MNITFKLKLFLSRTLLVYLFWTVSSVIATLLRFDGVFPKEKWIQILILSFISGSLNIIISYIITNDKSNYRTASIEEVISITVSVSLVTIIQTLLLFVFSLPSLPRSIPLVSGLISLIIQFFSRLVLRRNVYKSLYLNSEGNNTLIYGAGTTGKQLAEQMLIKSSEYKPIGFLDDHIKNDRLRIFGREIFGGINKLEEIVMNYDVKNLIIAFSGIDTKELIDIENRCRKLSITLKIIPNPFEILSRNLQIADIATISMEDLLGRRPITPDESTISKFLVGKKILVTGAGGSIGSEIARQVHRFSPDNLFLLDRDENSLLKLQLDLVGDGLLANQNIILADIRDSERLSEIINKLSPDIIFHAAALKHLAILEKYPDEAFKTNVTGTKNLIDAALKNGVKYFVNISTDKAADPISQLGKTKLLTERMISDINDSDKKYISVRFGNVIGSNGSFLNTFRHQIKLGGPIKVTHPDVTRYFMTVSEAVHLVLQSILIGECGETLILDMGDPVSIDSVAKHMINISGKNIRIEYTGLRKGEKLHEALISANELTYRGNHKDIIHTRVNPVSEDKS